MAIINEPLLIQEQEWIRYDNASFQGLVNNGFSVATNAPSYGGSALVALSNSSYLSFTFKGTGLRIIGEYRNSNRASDNIVEIDGVVYTFSQLGGSGWIFQTLNFEKLNLENKTHIVKIYGKSLSSSVSLVIDAIDILPTKQGAVLKNPQTNQHYSLADKTLIPLPDASSKNMILHGVEAGKEIQLDEDFDKINYPVEGVLKSTTKTMAKPLSIKFE